MSQPAGDAGKQVASGGEEEELNDRVEDLDATEEEKQGPQENSGEKYSSARRRRTRSPADNLTPAQRQQKRDQEERAAQ